MSAGGHQPMPNEDGNHLDHLQRRDLQPRRPAPRAGTAPGTATATHCDTETILHAYEQYGPDCVSHFRGMFAFAIWDKHTREAFCARDRLGNKALLLLLGRPHVRLRVARSRRCCEHPAISAAIRRVAAPRVPGFRLHQRGADAVPRHPQADAGPSPHARLCDTAALRLRSASTGISRIRSGRRAQRRQRGSPNAATAWKRPSACA